LLGGNLSGFEDRVGMPRAVLFFIDSDYARASAKTLAGEIGLPLDETGKALTEVAGRHVRGKLVVVP
jgi:hypothetical protein